MIRTLLSVFAVGCGNVSVSTPKQIPDTEEEKRIIDSPDGGGKLPMKEAVKKLKAPTPESEDQLPANADNWRQSKLSPISLCSRQDARVASHSLAVQYLFRRHRNVHTHRLFRDTHHAT